MLEKNITWAIINKHGVRPVLGSKDSVDRKNEELNKTNPDLYGVVKLVRIEYHEANDVEIAERLESEDQYKEMQRLSSGEEG